MSEFFLMTYYFHYFSYLHTFRSQAAPVWFIINDIFYIFQPNSDLLGMIQILTIVFGEEPPVYSKSQTPLPTSAAMYPGQTPYPASGDCLLKCFNYLKKKIDTDCMENVSRLKFSIRVWFVSLLFWNIFWYCWKWKLLLAQQIKIKLFQHYTYDRKW